MTVLKNRVKFNTTTTGTGDITVGSAVSGFRTPASAGVSDGEVFSYSIEDGANWEVGRGTYTASGATFSRTVLQSSNSDAAINLSGSAVISISALAEDILPTSFQDAALQLWVGGTQLTLHSSSISRYKIDGGICHIKAVLAAASGQSLTGVLEIRNLPVPPVGVSAIAGISILGMGEERNSGSWYYQSRIYYQAEDNLRLRQYPTYLDSSWNVVGDATFANADMIIIDISYEI